MNTQATNVCAMREAMARTSSGVLHKHLAWLQTLEEYQTIGYGADPLRAVTRNAAIALCEQTLVARAAMPVPDLLRHHAEHCDSPRDDEFANLASWVGSRTAAWQEVFSWSAAEAGGPWFQHLDDAGQRTALLLVAEILDSRQ